ncbi:porin family protein [Algiphilus aromaticivorans]|jgi:hypothetical protein|uniref:carbohydrate porin n=1 Tax=Algiphilus aromaticivorans TaxID=382454 RepID=UPI000AFBC73E|nr:carbohydrate porin [Algiphilus aromaticivorans]
MKKEIGAFALAAAVMAPVASVQAEEEDGIHVGGAVRFQYSFEDYTPQNRNRGGDLDLDTFRINLDGTLGDVILSAEWRYYQYMQVIHHAWVGYDFSDAWQGRVGIQQVPFGVRPYNSHNFFFSSAYYVGLEDDYDFGVVADGDLGAIGLQIGFFKNDEQGGLDGFVDNRTDRYSYDVISDGTNPIAEKNTASLRATVDAAGTEFGLSGLYGGLEGSSGSAGDYMAYAAHMNGNYGPVNVMLQIADYEYDLDNGNEALGVGAYSFADSIASEATIYTANLAYNIETQIGPITAIQLYNDYSLITDKSADLRDTQMNVTGFSVVAGGIFAYFDFIMARNQPFIGGTMVGNETDWNSRFNINVGYYF